MTPEQIRLECLKLAMGMHAVQGIEFAKANALKFESFVREAEPFGERAPNYRYHVHGPADGKTGTPA